MSVVVSVTFEGQRVDEVRQMDTPFLCSKNIIYTLLGKLYAHTFSPKEPNLAKTNICSAVANGHKVNLHLLL